MLDKINSEAGAWTALEIMVAAILIIVVLLLFGVVID